MTIDDYKAIAVTMDTDELRSMYASFAMQIEAQSDRIGELIHESNQLKTEIERVKAERNELQATLQKLDDMSRAIKALQDK